MEPIWQQHLTSAGALIEDGRVAHFGDPAGELDAAPQGALADLSHYGLIAFAGEDAQTFLQGQTTNDVRQVGAQRAQAGALCTHQGRMLANFLLFYRNDEYLMAVPAALQASLQKRLTMYVLRSKVKVRDAREEVVRFGVFGAAAAAALSAVCGAVPEGDYAVLEAAGAQLAALPGGRYEVIAEAARATELWQALAQHCRPVGAACWEWATLRAGFPVILPATQEQFTPQMTNLEVLGGVSFSKGCYTGQEVVARTQHIGKVKRRLYLAHVGGTVQPQPGEALAGTEHGTVVNAAPAPAGGFDLLAVISVDDRERGELSWAGEKLDFLPPPYPLP